LKLCRIPDIVVCPKPKNYRYIETILQKTVLSKLVLSYQPTTI